MLVPFGMIIVAVETAVCGVTLAKVTQAAISRQHAWRTTIAGGLLIVECKRHS
jgi:hypothetical protein